MSNYSVPRLLVIPVVSLVTGLYLWDQEPATSTGKFQSAQSVFTELDVNPLKASLNQQEPVTVTLGGLPCSKGGKSVSLPDFATAMGGQIRERYLYPNGSIIGFGYDVDGYLRVSIWNGPPPPENVSSIEAVYAMLDERAREMGIEQIPVKFTIFTSPPVLTMGSQIEPHDQRAFFTVTGKCPD